MFIIAIQVQAISASKVKITVDVNNPGHKISPTLFGIFFEDINLSADGGIYPELVHKRSFEDAESFQNWKFISTEDKSKAAVYILNVQSRPTLPPLNAFNCKSFLVIAGGSFKLENEGFWGMNIVQGQSYSLKLAARAIDNFSLPLKVRLVSSTGSELASGEIKGFDEKWQYYSLSLAALGNESKAYLQISGEGSGKLYLDMVSLMPEKTWKNHGMRVDLSEVIPKSKGCIGLGTCINSAEFKDLQVVSPKTETIKIIWINV